MRRHILDHPRAIHNEAAAYRYLQAARSLLSGEGSGRFLALQRRTRGRYNPSARLRAFVRIERGYRA